MPHAIHTRKLIFLTVLLSIFGGMFLSGCTSLQTENKEAEVTPIMKTDSPVIDISKINRNRFLLLSTRAFVKQEGEKFNIFLQGRLNIVKIAKNNFIQEWNYSLERFRVFSYPLVKQNCFVVAAEDSPNLFNNETEVLMFSLDDFKFKRIANVSYFVFSINSEDFNRDGREDLLLTGYDPRLDLGKITLLENTSEGFRKAFECAIGNKTFDAFVSDVNKAIQTSQS